MKVIEARNVNDAYQQGLALLRREGRAEGSRAGRVLVVPTPVATTYDRPTERVLLDPGRDANPFFHFFESLWMLSGRRDATWLDRFVKDFSSRFAEDDGQQHGAYGFRWRFHFDVEGGGHSALPDQLDAVVGLLRANPQDRRVVLTIWDPVADLGASKRDIPCNTHAYLRLRAPSWREAHRRWEEQGNEESSLRDAIYDCPVLDLTVCCRSNDAIWGAYGANAVHFSMLQEYLAGRLGAGVGRYCQVSNNFHVYEEVLAKAGPPGLFQPYAPTDPASWQVAAVPIGHDWPRWDSDLYRFMENVDRGMSSRRVDFYNEWFFDVAEAMLRAHICWKAGEKDVALQYASLVKAADWRAACIQWMERRIK